MSTDDEGITLKMRRGDARTWTFRALERDGVTPLSLTGKTVRFTAKRNLGDADDAPGTFVRMTPGANGVTVPSASFPADDSYFDVSTVPENTSGLTADLTILAWDAQLATDAGNPLTILWGDLEVWADVGLTAP